MNLEQLKSLAASAGFQGDDINIAAAIAMAESGGDPCANGDPHNQSDCTNPYTSKSFGLWQIDTAFHPGSKATLTDPTANAQAAYAIYRAAGSNFQPWSTAWNDPVHRTGYLGASAPFRQWYTPSAPVAAGWSRKDTALTIAAAAAVLLAGASAAGWLDAPARFVRRALTA